MTKKAPWRGHRRPGDRRFSKPVARKILKRNPVCALGLPGCTETSTEADHIVGWGLAMAQGWTQAEYDHPSNGQGVCSSCHRQKTLQQATQGRKMAKKRRKEAEKASHPGILAPEAEIGKNEPKPQ